MGSNGQICLNTTNQTTEYKTVFISGIEALVKLPLLQRQLDRIQGLNTAGLISGYRGSPLGVYDQHLWKSEKELNENGIIFQPGLNEDLAATALWGAQMHAAYGPTQVDGVFGIWYGKGPGVDRTGDVFRSANVMGTSKLGGVLAVSGDDHAAQSSLFPHQTDTLFQAVSMPVLQPANIAEIIEFGLAGIALSRYSGLWVAMKTIADVVESASVIDIATPHAFITPADEGRDHLLNWDATIQWPAQRFELEKRLIDDRLPAVQRWARLNRIDKVIHLANTPKIGIVTVGKAHQDLMQAITDLGWSDEDLNQYGISIYKVGMSWPLETQGMIQFAQGQQELFVIEEKRANVESQIKEALYHLDATQRPQVSGKKDPSGQPLLAETLEFSPLLIATALIQRLGQPAALVQKLQAMYPVKDMAVDTVMPSRTPYFCSGCPHNTSTQTPEGSISGGGIGCHVMALMVPALKTTTISQMGGEGAQWIGAQPFSKTPHIFQNLGDGTYEHSGILAIRAAVAAQTNITFKILYNDAVAMTGGQHTEGTNDPARISRQLSAEGVASIALVSDHPEVWEKEPNLASITTVHHRDELEAVQKKFRELSGTTAIIYVQTCATEKRRRRKKQLNPVATNKAFINTRVCEGCGDCSTQSNCIAIEPVETAFGRKRKINQSSCNTDFSCLKGFCPSFIEVEGAALKKTELISAALEQQYFAELVVIEPPQIQSDSFNILFAGIGGTGVLTVGAIVGQAAVYDHKISSVLDFTGLAQKNGAVLSQVRLSQHKHGLHASRIGAHSTHLLMAADLVYAASEDILQRLAPEQSAVVANLDITPTAAVVHHRDAAIDQQQLIDKIKAHCLAEAFHPINVNQISTQLFGDHTYTHVLMLGYAWQKGLIPLSLHALQSAIDQGVLPVQNHRALNWGRVLASNKAALNLLMQQPSLDIHHDDDVDELKAKYYAELIQYQNKDYADRFSQLMDRVSQKCASLGIEDQQLIKAVMHNAYRVMAYKDEYEVARLYASKEFKQSLNDQFDHVAKISLWLAPPFFSKVNPDTGRPNKIKFGAWILKLMPLLASFKWLRGKIFDPFAINPERKVERKMVEEYFDLIEHVLTHLSRSNYAIAIETCDCISQVRGYGPVKLQALQQYYPQRDALLNKLKHAKNLINIATPA